MENFTAKHQYMCKNVKRIPADSSQTPVFRDNGLDSLGQSWAIFRRPFGAKTQSKCCP